MTALDPIDQKLIAMLRSNSRKSIVELAKELGVSRATVQNRMRRLEKQGTILGYTIKLDSGSGMSPVRAFMTIAIEGKKIPDVTRALKGYPDIVALHDTNGRWDMVAEIHTHSLKSFNQLLGNIRLIDGVLSTETSLLFKTLNL